MLIFLLAVYLMSDRSLFPDNQVLGRIKLKYFPFKISASKYLKVRKYAKIFFFLLKMELRPKFSFTSYILAKIAWYIKTFKSFINQCNIATSLKKRNRSPTNFLHFFQWILNVSLWPHAIEAALNCVGLPSFPPKQRRQLDWYNIMFRGMFTAVRVNCPPPSHGNRVWVLILAIGYWLHTTKLKPSTLALIFAIIFCSYCWLQNQTQMKRLKKTYFINVS